MRFGRSTKHKNSSLASRLFGLMIALMFALSMMHASMMNEHDLPSRGIYLAQNHTDEHKTGRQAALSEPPVTLSVARPARPDPATQTRAISDPAAGMLYSPFALLDPQQPAKATHVGDRGVAVFVLSRRSARAARATARKSWAKSLSNVFFVVGTCCTLPPASRAPLSCSAVTKHSTATSLETGVESQGEDDDAEQASLVVSMCNEEERALEKEQKMHQDILRVPTPDVYSNVPQKLKYAFTYAADNTTAKWALVVGQNSVVRVKTLEHYLWQSYAGWDENIAFVIGNIVKNRSVPRSGPKAETLYLKNAAASPGMVYPRFAAKESGFLVSLPVARYVAENKDRLVDYKDVDVSLGIWLSEWTTQIRWTESKHMTTKAARCQDTETWVIGSNVQPAEIEECFASLSKLTNLMKYVFVLNLEKQPERWQRTVKLAMRAGFPNVKRVVGVDALLMPNPEAMVHEHVEDPVLSNRCGLQFNGKHCALPRTPFCNEKTGWCSSLTRFVKDKSKFNYDPAPGSELLSSNEKQLSPNKGWIANYLGIRNLLTEAVYKGHDTFFMLEDDVFFAKDFPSIFERTMAIVGPEFDAVYLGLSVHCYAELLSIDGNRAHNHKQVEKVWDINSHHSVYTFKGSIKDKVTFVGGNFGVVLKKAFAQRWLDGCMPIRTASDVRFTKLMDFQTKIYFIHPPIVNYYWHESNIDSGSLDSAADPALLVDPDIYDLGEKVRPKSLPSTSPYQNLLQSPLESTEQINREQQDLVRLQEQSDTLLSNVESLQENLETPYDDNDRTRALEVQTKKAEQTIVTLQERPNPQT
jgi:hypothetical protein